MLEGLCNSLKLSEFEDQLELRFMDEFFSIEGTLGEVKAVISLQFNKEPEYIRDEEIEYEKFEPKAAVVEKKKPAEGEEEEEPAAEGDDGPKAPTFNKEDFQWTISNRKSKNLPQLFIGCKGINTQHEYKNCYQFGQNTPDQITKSIDEFCGRLQDSDNADKYLYQQVIFI